MYFKVAMKVRKRKRLGQLKEDYAELQSAFKGVDGDAERGVTGGFRGFSETFQ